MNDASRQLPGSLSQFALFLRLRWNLLRNTVQVLFQQASVRMVSIVLCSLVVFIFFFLVGLSGFNWIKVPPQSVPAFGNIVGVLFDFLFVALSVMLVFSTALILYSSLFVSDEAAFLLSTPAPADQIFAYKYQGALAFSSWGFLLLSTPVLLAYGIVYSVHWAFYALLPLFFFGFVLLPASIGALVCLLVVNYIPRQRRQVLVAVALSLIVVAGVWVQRTSRLAQNQTETREVANRLLGQLILSQGPLVPSHWMTRGLQTAGQGYLLWGPHGDAGALYYLALVWSNGLFFYLLATELAVLLYRRGYNRVQTGSALRRRYSGHWLDRCLSYLVHFLDPQTRLLIIKDFRTFRRDPAQWAQILLFTVLMLLYVTNIRRLFIADIDWAYQNGISLLNLGTTGLLLCIFTGRFIFPMLSLEGRKFWILGLLPLRRERLLWGKFAFAATGGLLIAEVLVLLSDLMLGLPWLAVLLHALTVAVLAVGLSGLSVGLGACLPNFQETDPSKIAAGFGGTLNLVAGLLFLLVIIALMALPWHIVAAVLQDSDHGFTVPQLLLLFPALIGVSLGIAATWLPLRAGAQALKRMEF
jgi:ABC-2 type transport system permease protein